MTEVCKLLKIKHIKTSGYQPQGNSVERLHRYMNAAITIQCHEYHLEWDECLDAIMYVYRASVSRSTAYSPFEMVYGRPAPLAVDSLFDKQEEPKSAHEYVRRLEKHLAVIYARAAAQQYRVQQQNASYRDGNEKRKEVQFEVGDAVLVWGPVTKNAPYLKSKLLYQWSEPFVVKTKVSKLHYILMQEQQRAGGKVMVETTAMHVNRLRPYTPWSDGRPSISNEPPLQEMWANPTALPVTKDFVILKTPEEGWRGWPFLVGKVLKVVAPKQAGGVTTFVLHWHGNNKASSAKGPYKPGYVDSMDNKLVFGPADKAMLKRSKEWSSAITKQVVSMQDILMVNPVLTKAGMLSSESMRLLATCPHIDWAGQLDVDMFE
jgi:hypothetical protein